MAEYDHRAWPASAEAAQPDWIRPADRCGRMTDLAAIQNFDAVANENMLLPDFELSAHLPPVIVAAVVEWANHLRQQDWRLRRRAMKRFAESFADQFLALKSDLSDEEYESLKEIGHTCLLEQLEDGRPIADIDQARCYLESVHEAHRLRAEAFMAVGAPKSATVH